MFPGGFIYFDASCINSRVYLFFAGAATHGRITGILLSSIYIQKEQGLARPALLLFSRAAPALHSAVPALVGGGVSRYAAVDLLHAFIIPHFASALSIFPVIVFHRLSWVLSSLTLGPVSCIPQMEPLAGRAVIFACAVPRRKRRAAVDA